MRMPHIPHGAAKAHIAVTLPLLALLVYNTFLVRIYGFGVQNISPDRISLFVLWSLSNYLCLPDRVERPSDVFWTFYMFLCGIWGAALWGVNGSITLVEGVVWMVLLHAPAYAFKGISVLASRSVDGLPLPSLFQERLLVLPLVMLLILAILATLGAASIGSFDFLSIYDRRLAGREIIPERSVQAYIFGMAVNGSCAILAYIAGRHRSLLAAAATAVFCIYAYWLLGLRSQFLNVLLLFSFGTAVRLSLMSRLQIMLVWGTFGAVLLFVVEYWTTGYSHFADYIIRRVTLVQPEVQSFYVDAVLSNPLEALRGGVSWHDFSDVTYFIGHSYLNNDATNTNTNGFFYAIAKFGVLGYISAVAVVCVLLVAVDQWYARTRLSGFLAVAALYGILIAEQSYSSALFTSGVLPCLIVIALFSRQEKLQFTGPAK